MSRAGPDGPLGLRNGGGAGIREGAGPDFRARLAGRFPELEAELAGMTYGGGYEGPGRSPDRADAMVWAMKELIRPRPAPRIRQL